MPLAEFIPKDAPESYFPTLNHEHSNYLNLIAVTENLTAKRVLSAYQQGIFPWYESDDLFYWFMPHPRMVFIPNQWQASRSLRRLNKKANALHITFNQAFEQVMHGCQQPRAGDCDTWITQNFLRVYQQLHLQKWAHSIEVWQGKRLVGGLYGLGIGHMFFGDSMFSKIEGASKIAFMALMAKAHELNWNCIDGQVESDHLKLLGGTLISRRKYLDLLSNNPNQKIILN